MTSTKISGPSGLKLLTFNNAKTIKGMDKNFFTFILYLAPHKLSGYNVCPKASQGCIASCLNTAGQGIFSNVQAARIRKTKLFFEKRDEFLTILKADIIRSRDWALARGYTPVYRLNGTSDLPHFKSLMREFPDIQFYDYYKNEAVLKDKPDNHHLTYSRSELTPDSKVLELISKGVNVAVVFSGKELPKTWLGVPVINGDETDLRFLDGSQPNGKGFIVGLKAKGKARKDTSGFVVLSETLAKVA